jgi:hypothetical protein
MLVVIGRIAKAALRNELALADARAAAEAAARATGNDAGRPGPQA